VNDIHESKWFAASFSGSKRRPDADDMLGTAGGPGTKAVRATAGTSNVADGNNTAVALSTPIKVNSGAASAQPFNEQYLKFYYSTFRTPTHRTTASPTACFDQWQHVQASCFLTKLCFGGYRTAMVCKK
jgi:hypothetical protein